MEGVAEVRDREAEAAGFDAAFAETETREPDVKIVETRPINEPVAEEVEEQADESPREEPTAETPPEDPREKELTELRTMVSRIPELEKRLRDEGGRYGALKQNLEELQRKFSTNSIRVNQQALERIKSEFPELGIAELFAGQADAEPTPEPAEKKPDERDVDFNEAMSVLNDAHPEWQQLRDNPTPEYKEWLASLRPGARAHFINSKDPYHVAEKLDEFDAWRDQRATAQPEPAPAPTNTTARLEQAIQPEGRKTTVKRALPGEEEGFLSAFKPRS